MKELETHDICIAVGSTHALAKSKLVSFGTNGPRTGPRLQPAKEYPDYRKHLDKMFKNHPPEAPHRQRAADGVTSLLAAVEAGNGFSLVPSCVSGMAGPADKAFETAARPAASGYCRALA